MAALSLNSLKLFFSKKTKGSQKRSPVGLPKHQSIKAFRRDIKMFTAAHEHDDAALKFSKVEFSHHFSAPPSGSPPAGQRRACEFLDCSVVLTFFCWSPAADLCPVGL